LRVTVIGAVLTTGLPPKLTDWPGTVIGYGLVTPGIPDVWLVVPVVWGGAVCPVVVLALGVVPDEVVELVIAALELEPPFPLEPPVFDWPWLSALFCTVTLGLWLGCVVGASACRNGHSSTSSKIISAVAINDKP